MCFFFYHPSLNVECSFERLVLTFGCYFYPERSCTKRICRLYKKERERICCLFICTPTLPSTHTGIFSVSGVMETKDCAQSALLVNPPARPNNCFVSLRCSEHRGAGEIQRSGWHCFTAHKMVGFYPQSLESESVFRKEIKNIFYSVSYI